MIYRRAKLVGAQLSLPSLDPLRLPTLLGLLFGEYPGLLPSVPKHNLFDRLTAHRAVFVLRVAERNQAVDLVIVRDTQSCHQLFSMGEREVEDGAAQAEGACREEQVLHGGKRAAAR